MQEKKENSSHYFKTFNFYAKKFRFGTLLMIDSPICDRTGM